jgi:hypothetical protein
MTTIQYILPTRDFKKYFEIVLVNTELYPNINLNSSRWYSVLCLDFCRSNVQIIQISFCMTKMHRQWV